MPDDKFPFFLTKDEEACGMETGGETAASYQDMITLFCKQECKGGIVPAVSSGYIAPSAVDFMDESGLDDAFDRVMSAVRDAHKYRNTTYTVDLVPFEPFKDMDYVCDNAGSIKNGMLVTCDETGANCEEEEEFQIVPPNPMTPITMPGLGI
jgi:hypothetical protein